MSFESRLPEANLPTAAEIAVDFHDGHYAIEHFAGKTLEEAEELFAAGCPLFYTEDLVYMKPIGFRFYVQAAIRYCLSDRATYDSDIVNGLASVLSLWRQYNASELVPIAGLLSEFCGSVDQQFGRYHADPEIYVGLREKYRELAQYFMRPSDEANST